VASHRQPVADITADMSEDTVVLGGNAKNRRREEQNENETAVRW